MITVFGGSQLRPNIHIDDMADLYVLALAAAGPTRSTAGLQRRLREPPRRRRSPRSFAASSAPDVGDREVPDRRHALLPHLLRAHPAGARLPSRSGRSRTPSATLVAFAPAAYRRRWMTPGTTTCVACKSWRSNERGPIHRSRRAAGAAEGGALRGRRARAHAREVHSRPGSWSSRSASRNCVEPGSPSESTSGTDALVLALRALDIGPGDEVITSQLVRRDRVGDRARRRTACLRRRREDITSTRPRSRLGDERTRAILPVHLTGRPAAMDKIMDVAAHHLAWWRIARRLFSPSGTGVGRSLRCASGCFSLHPLKTLGAAGDGGVLDDSDESLARSFACFATSVSSARRRASSGAEFATGHDPGGDDAREASRSSSVDRGSRSMQLHTGRVSVKPLASSSRKSGPTRRHVYHTFVIQADERDELKHSSTGSESEPRSTTRCRSTCRRSVARSATARVTSPPPSGSDEDPQPAGAPWAHRAAARQRRGGLLEFIESRTSAPPLPVSFSYLDRQFADLDAYLDDIRTLVRSSKLRWVQRLRSSSVDLPPSAASPTRSASAPVPMLSGSRSSWSESAQATR